MPRWVIPALILFLLVLAFAFRWEEGPKKTYDWNVMAYKYDRWTKQNWCKIYSPQRVKEFTVPPGREEDRHIATGIWTGLVTLTSIWLLFSIKKPAVLNKIGWKIILQGIGGLFFLYVLIALCVTLKPEMLPAFIAFLIVSFCFVLSEKGGKQ